MESRTPDQGYSVLHLFDSKNLQRAPTTRPVADVTAGLDEVEASGGVVESVALASGTGVELLLEIADVGDNVEVAPSLKISVRVE